MTVYELANKLKCEILAMPEQEKQVQSPYIGDLLSWVMSNAESNCIWITIITNPNICAVAVLIDVGCIIIAENAQISDETILVANQRGVNILRSHLSAYDLALSLSLILDNEKN